MPGIPKCPDDGSWLAVIPTPRSTSYLCPSCGKGFEASMKDGSLKPDPPYGSLPNWLIGLIRDRPAPTSG